ncbi:N1R/p28-like protein [Mythimna separata entomopoxvirus 'L']|uniref:N1R/p28-like protein n=1 Tax=Mythimna separata entomopoxvirus 'L' TaxID=1293572 RepID=A0A916NZ09_9POXV|nr:N1R/p28-like protein [Mythimna separata entomopoxvirus 'L']CCU56499.1 N1R/p28-like protein [Mythimna separata entomopoxvirus 'L']
MSSLNDICYEKIKDSFYYGLFSDFKLIIDKNTGYFNATKLCKDGGRRFKKWLENYKSKELIRYIDDNTPSPNSGRVCVYDNFNIKYKNNVIYEIYFKNNDKINDIVSGTYVSKDLVLSISIWISNEFYIKCSNIIENYYINDFKLKYENNVKNLTEKINNLEIDKNNIISRFNSDIKPKIINVPRDIEIYSNIVLIKLNYDDKYYITTVRDRDLHKKIRKLRNTYSDMRILYRLSEVPNAKYLYDNIKNRLIEEEIVEFYYSTFNFKEITDDYRILEIAVTDIMDEEYENVDNLE